MKQKTIWELLEIPSTTNQKDIKTAYAKQAKLVHPEEHPEEFIQLNEAYRQAIQYAKAHQQVKQAQPNTTPSQDNSTTIPLEATLDFSSLEHQSSVSTHKQKTEKETINVHAVLTKAKQKLELQYEQQRTDTLHQIETMLAHKRTSMKRWNEFLESTQFLSISLDPAFLKQLLTQLQAHTFIPLNANYCLTNYYQKNDTAQVEGPWISLMLSRLDELNKHYELYQKKHKKRFLYVYLLICILFVIFMYFMSQTSDPKKRASIDYALEAYGEQVTYESTVELNESINYDIYTFYDQTNDFYFHIKETKHEEVYEFEDDYASSMVLSKNTASLIHSYKQYDPTSIYYDDSMIDGVSIQIIDHDIKASTTELYTFLQTIRALPEIQQVKDNVFIYVMPKGAYYRKWFQEAIPFSEALEMSEAQLYDWLAYCDTIYTLEYTFKEYDETDPYVKRYMSEAQGVDLMIQGTQVHVDGVKVMDGKLSIGSFYRLAKALDLDIEVTSETSLLWKIHGRIQLIGTGSVDPYIEQSFIEEVLQP